VGMEILDGGRFVFVVVAVHSGWFSGDTTEVMCGLKEDDGCVLGLLRSVVLCGRGDGGRCVRCRGSGGCSGLD
jgi:hypothetical protein